MKEKIRNSILSILDECVWSRTLVKIRISGPNDESILYKDLTVKLVELKSGTMLQFLYKYEAKVITKNYSLDESKDLLINTIPKFKNLSIITVDHSYQYNKGRNKLYKAANKQKQSSDTSHNKGKDYLISQDKAFLKELGITNASGNIKANKGAKFKQINKYVEIMNSLISDSDLGNKFTILDMGSGKGYLTFALYDYLNSDKNYNVTVKGIELRSTLIAQCNSTAESCGYNNLSFAESDIVSYEVGETDVLVALHACDTATDDAIAKGIKANSKLIVCSPCCHKQIRKQMKNNIRLNALTKYGIILERQAEIITDILRTLILELNGYTTKIMEFISSEHTAKNLLIVAIKNSKPVQQEQILNEINLLKNEFGIEYHYLEKALNTSK